MVHVLQKAIAGVLSPAIDTFVMVGFNSKVECLAAWQHIAGSSDTPATVYQLSEYLETFPQVHRFVDETGNAALITKCGSVEYKLGTLTSLMAKFLVRQNVVIIDVKDPILGDNNELLMPSLTDIPNVNDDIRKRLLLGAYTRGNYIHMSGEEIRLREFLEKSQEIAPDTIFLTVYIDTKISTMQTVENILWTYEHMSIVTTNDCVMQLDIEDCKFHLSLILEESEASLSHG